MTRELFESRMVAWINARFARPGMPPIAAESPLFAGRLIDSIRILELIAWTERATGREIPDVEIVTVPNVGHAPDLSEPESVAGIDRLLERVLKR